jgi:hypothetical protein
LQNLQDLCRKNYNKNTELKKEWGGGEVGIKSRHREARKTKIAEEELATKAQI